MPFSSDLLLYCVGTSSDIYWNVVYAEREILEAMAPMPGPCLTPATKNARIHTFVA